MNKNKVQYLKIVTSLSILLFCFESCQNDSKEPYGLKETLKENRSLKRKLEELTKDNESKLKEIGLLKQKLFKVTSDSKITNDKLDSYPDLKDSLQRSTSNSKYLESLEVENSKIREKLLTNHTIINAGSSYYLCGRYNSVTIFDSDGAVINDKSIPACFNAKSTLAESNFYHFKIIEIQDGWAYISRDNHGLQDKNQELKGWVKTINLATPYILTNDKVEYLLPYIEFSKVEIYHSGYIRIKPSHSGLQSLCQRSILDPGYAEVLDIQDDSIPTDNFFKAYKPNYKAEFKIINLTNRHQRETCGT